jgi:hypothetical protein
MSEKEMNRMKLWELLTSEKWQVEPPVFSELALRRILVSSEDKPLVLFTPWGPPYNKEGLNLNNSPEVKSIKWLAEIAELFNAHRVSIKWIFLAANVYGTEINRLGSLNGSPRIKEEVVERYFFNLKKPIVVYIRHDAGTLETWSQIRSRYRAVYNLIQQEYTEEKVKQLISESRLKEMTRTAQLINRLNSREEAEVMAIGYLQERICEALLVEEIWHPIKISLASKKNDEVVDMELPRLYLVSKELQTPWLVNS